MDEDRSKKEIYHDFRTLVMKAERESPLLSNLGIGLSFSSKFTSLEIMQEITLEKAEKLFESYKEEKSKPSVFSENLNRYSNECIAFFEAYLNAFYSLLQIIGKVTPYFFNSDELKRNVLEGYFERQFTHFKKHPETDYEYSDYLANMSWHKELIFNRHAITHNASAFLGFGKDEVVFIHMPKKRIDYFENGKPTRKLIEYISANWNSLFDFLDFCVNHLSNREIFVNKEKEMETVRQLVFKGTQQTTNNAK